MGAPAAVETRLTRIQWAVLGLLVISIAVNYIDRGTLSVAAPFLASELHLTKTQLGSLFSTFFWTYAAFQLVAGWLVDRYDVRWVLGLGFLIWSLATLFTGMVNTFGALFLLRLLLGMGESVAYPSYSRILASSFPERHRGTANALIDAGCKVGPAVGVLIGGLVVGHFGWRALFLVLGLGGLVWLLPWGIWGPHPVSMKAVRHEDSPGILQILRQRDAWGTFLGLFCVNYAWYFLVFWLPSYLVMERHFSANMMAVFGSVPFWGIALSSTASGWASDRLIARGGSPTRVRKAFMAGGMLLSTLILSVAMVRDPVISMVLLIVVSLCYGLFTSNLWAITQTLAGPEAAGKWTGWQNMVGNFAGIVGPWLTGRIVDVTGQFLLAFVAVCIALVVGATSYLVIVGELKPVDWRAR
ncbi:MAG: MFS transporter [Acidobacteriia bacterium]|nr:MFS transporter [Terriglobia bacterium]